MEYGEHHHSGLDDAKALKKMDAVSHGEGCQNIDDQNHRECANGIEASCALACVEAGELVNW